MVYLKKRINKLLFFKYLKTKNKSMEDFSKFNEVYLKYFTGTSKPARSCVAMKEF